VRDFLAREAGVSATALQRALREDVDFRFVAVGKLEDAGAWQHAVADPGFPGAQMPFEAHGGLYEVVREHARPDVSGGVLLINAFQVPGDADEPFLLGWDRARETLAQQQGYMGTRLHRSVTPADFRFVNIARWSSPLMFARALKRPEFLQAAAELPFRSHAALYTVI
jgi:heme-degrading monooxygenase HmoA